MTLNQFIFRFPIAGVFEESKKNGLESKTENLLKISFEKSDNNTIPLFVFNDKNILELNPQIMTVFSTTVGLLFIHENETTGNTCFSNSPEIRNDFKTTFTKSDILDYTFACLKVNIKEKKQIDTTGLKLPKNQEEFWKMVQLGSE
jgi:hypothetical protein